MTSAMVFSNSQWFWPALFCGLFLLVVYIWKERVLFPKLKFYVHAYIALAAIACLFFMVLKPQVLISKESKSIVLLTEGYSEERLDSLKGLYNNIDISKYNAGTPIIRNGKIPKNIFLLGRGVEAYDLWQFDSIKTQFLKEARLDGISAFKYPPSVSLGSEIQFKGEYTGGVTNSQLYLADSGGNELDSVALLAAEVQRFELSAIPKVVGSSLYFISEKDSLGNLLFNDPVPVKVSEEKNLKVWIVNSFPSFETKYLKNFLSELGHEVTVRSRLTQSRFKYEYFNVPQRKSIRFDRTLLKEVDLLIMDVASLRNLSGNARNAIESTLREDGLGVFIQPEEGMFGERLPLLNLRFKASNLVEITLDRWPRIVIPSSGFEFSEDKNLESVIVQNNQIFAGYRRIGAGRIGTTAFLGTYELLLEGNTTVYQTIWSEIFQSLGKDFVPSSHWKSTSFPSYANESLGFEIRTRATEPQVLLDEEETIPLEQDIVNQQLWRGSFYPTKAGWHELSLKGASAQKYQLYVQDSSAWTTVRSYENLKANERYFNASEVKETELSSTYMPMNLLWFFIVFLICMGYLWLVPKL